jgi:hypothetical protein
MMKKNCAEIMPLKIRHFFLKSSNFVTKHENHHVTKLADQYGNSVTQEMHQKQGLGAGKVPK